MSTPKPNKRNMQAARRQPKRRAASFVGNIRHDVLSRFGQAVRVKRKALGFTQFELAEASGLSRSYLSEVECGHESISLERAARLAKALGCELAELLDQSKER